MQQRDAPGLSIRGIRGYIGGDHALRLPRGDECSLAGPGALQKSRSLCTGSSSPAGPASWRCCSAPAHVGAGRWGNCRRVAPAFHFPASPRSGDRPLISAIVCASVCSVNGFSNARSSQPGACATTSPKEMFRVPDSIRDIYCCRRPVRSARSPGDQPARSRACLTFYQKEYRH